MNVFTKLNQPVKGGLILAELLKIREHRCECCGLSEWNGIPITLQVHHKDGDKTNNELENLQLLQYNFYNS